MKRKIYTISFIILTIIIVFVFNINQQAHLLQNETVYDNIKIVVQKTLKDEEEQSTALAFALARNILLKKALKQKDKVLGEMALNDSIEYLEKYSKNQMIQAQIFTASHRLFARSFTPEIKTQNKTELNNKISLKRSVDLDIEQGLKLKATVPIFENNALLGYVQVVTDFESLVQKLRHMQLEFFPLLLSQYASSLGNTPILLNQLSLATHNANKKILSYIQNLDKDSKRRLIQKDYLHTSKGFFLLYPFINTKGEVIGKQIVYMPRHQIKRFYTNDYSVLQSIFNLNSTKEDIYNFVKYENENMFLNIERAYIANLRDVVDPKDLQEFEEVARNKLKKLSREELIDFILQKSSQSKIEGEIR